MEISGIRLFSVSVISLSMKQQRLVFCHIRLKITFKKNKKIRTAVTLLQYVDSGKKRKFYGSEA